jgi:UPF0755 protein
MEPDHAEPSDSLQTTDKQTPAALRKNRQVWVWVLVVDVLIFTPLLLLVGLFYLWNFAPSDFTSQTVIIEPGENVLQISQKLAEANVVQSEHVLFTILRYWQDPTQIKASTYTFTEPLDAFAVAEKLIIGEFTNDLTTLTFIEGMRARDYAEYASAGLLNVSKKEFITFTTGLEGLLFPETYFVPADFTTEQLIELLTTTHNQTMLELLTTATSSLTTDEIIILASIVEREANTPESMRIVAGVFLNRMAIGMPLQADASIEYVIDTPLGELAPGQLAAELRELDSPYNTYLNPGLPPTPIGNPGRTALAAVIDPILSDYFYYITGNDGEFYYSETYREHLLNIERHLR